MKKSQLIIAGENCEVNQETIEWNQYLELQSNITQFEIPQLTQLSRFLYEFNHGLNDIKPEGIYPMTQFTPGQGLESSYKDRLWRNVHKELTKTLVQIRGNLDNLRIDPPFILGLKVLLQVLAQEWADR